MHADMCIVVISDDTDISQEIIWIQFIAIFLILALVYVEIILSVRIYMLNLIQTAPTFMFSIVDEFECSDFVTHHDF